MKLSFLGAAQTVTGSKYLVETADARVLVDCGLFQGIKALRRRNWNSHDLHPRRLDAVVLTHAHIDHSGYLPRLYRGGFRGPVYCTAGTRELLQLLLPDSGYLQEEEARHANKHGWSRHRPALPLYTQKDAIACLELLRPSPFGSPIEVAPGVEALFSRAGHIVGSASVRLTTPEISLGFSGDVGRPNDLLMKPPAPIPNCDYLVVESTYGDRRHARADVLDQLDDILRETFEIGGTAVVPAFAVGRAQHLLHIVAELQAQGRIPQVPVFLDSPMAIDATEIFLRHPGDHRIDESQARRMSSVARYTNTPEQSKAIDRRSGPMLVISASGMATGGRILHHLRRFLPEKKNTVVLVGFQAAGTRGRSLDDGAEELKIFGDYTPVRARVERISSLSAHADYEELLAWLASETLTPRHVFVSHGEPSAADAFRRRLEERFGWSVVVPEDGQSFEL